MAAALTVFGHVVHLAVIARIQPALQVLGVLTQVDIADAQLLETQLPGPALDLPQQVAGFLLF
jgi:hypothetical protein